jgi:hypothetical protein
VIIGKHATIDLGRLEAGNIARVHLVIYALRHRAHAGRDAGFKVDDARRGARRVKVAKGLAPDIVKGTLSRNRPIGSLRKLDIAEG